MRKTKGVEAKRAAAARTTMLTTAIIMMNDCEDADLVMMKIRMMVMVIATRTPNAKCPTG